MRADRRRPAIALDRRLFELCRSIAIVNELPLRELVEHTLLAAFTSDDIFPVHARNVFDVLASRYRLNLYRLADKRLKYGILSRERKPKPRKRRAKANTT